MKIALRLLLVAVLSLQVVSCASEKKIDTSSPEKVIAGVNVGDEVNITTKNGKLQQFTITKITNKALYGEGYRVTFDEMQAVEVKTKDGVFKRIGNIF